MLWRAPPSCAPASESPLNRRSYPSGQTSAFVMKALLKYLDTAKGRPASDQWLKGIHVQRDDLYDETRPHPLTTRHRALQRFAELASREAIGDIWSYLIAPDNLGVWMRILRGTIVPADAFARLDSSDSEYGRTTRWETIDTKEGYWRGRVHIAHDPSLEQDGLLALARVAELAAVPALFGYGRGAVSARGVSTSTVSDVAQEFEVRWSVPSAMRTGPGGRCDRARRRRRSLSSRTLARGGRADRGGDVRRRALRNGGGTRAPPARRRRARRRRGVHALERSILLKENRELAAAGTSKGRSSPGSIERACAWDRARAA